MRISLGSLFKIGKCWFFVLWVLEVHIYGLLPPGDFFPALGCLHLSWGEGHLWCLVILNDCLGSSVARVVAEDRPRVVPPSISGLLYLVLIIIVRELYRHLQVFLKHFAVSTLRIVWLLGDLAQICYLLVWVRVTYWRLRLLRFNVMLKTCFRETTKLPIGRDDLGQILVQLRWGFGPRSRGFKIGGRLGFIVVIEHVRGLGEGLSKLIVAPQRNFKSVQPMLLPLLHICLISFQVLGLWLRLRLRYELSICPFNFRYFVFMLPFLHQLGRGRELRPSSGRKAFDQWASTFIDGTRVLRWGFIIKSRQTVIGKICSDILVKILLLD